jgi:hypothetical protein
MANRILSDRNGERVGKNWTINFVQRQPELKTRFNRKIDYERVLSEDLDAYNAWFRLVRNTINKYLAALDYSRAPSTLGAFNTTQPNLGRLLDLVRLGPDRTTLE